jgi:O-antigen/teichoic acid export membrane protein
MRNRGSASDEAILTTKNLSKIAAFKVAQYPLLAVFMMLVPRTLGAEIYGEYVLLLSILTIADALINFGIEEICARFVPEMEMRGGVAEVRRFYSSMLLVKIIVDIVAVTGLLLLLKRVYGDRFPDAYLIALISTVFLRDLQNTAYALLFGLNKLSRFSARDPIRRALSLGLVLLLVHFYGLFGAVVAMFLVEALLFSLGFYWTRTYLVRSRVDLKPRSLIPYVQFGFIFYLCWVLTNIWQRIGNVLIDKFTHNPHQVAIFDIPNQIFIITLSGILSLFSALVPMFVKLRMSGQEEKLMRWSRRMVKYGVALCTIIFAGFAIAGPGLIPWVIGREYADIYRNGAILLMGGFAFVIAKMGIVFSIVYNKPGRYFAGLTLAVASFLLAAALLIPRLQSMGAAMATGISGVVLAVAMSAFFRKQMIHCVRDAIMVAGAAVVIVPFLGFRGGVVSGLVGFLGFALVYGLLLATTGLVRVREIKEIIEAIRQRAAS